MKIPTPNKGESQKDFISRCIPYVIREGTTDDQKQATAICYSIWRKAKGVKNEMNSERVLLHLSAELKPFYDLKDEKLEPLTLLERSTIIVGDKTYNGVYFPKEELEKAFMSWDKQPINLDHSESIRNMVGYVEEPQYFNGKITVRPVLDEKLPAYSFAKAYIDSRIGAKAIPQVSVGVWIDRVPEEMEEGETRITARNLEGYHLALVAHGACSPQDGCGIGLEKKEMIPISAEQKIAELVKEQLEENEDDEFIKLKKEILKEKIKQEVLKK